MPEKNAVPSAILYDPPYEGVEQFLQQRRLSEDAAQGFRRDWYAARIELNTPVTLS